MRINEIILFKGPSPEKLWFIKYYSSRTLLKNLFNLDTQVLNILRLKGTIDSFGDLKVVNHDDKQEEVNLLLTHLQKIRSLPETLKSNSNLIQLASDAGDLHDKIVEYRRALTTVPSEEGDELVSGRNEELRRKALKARGIQEQFFKRKKGPVPQQPPYPSDFGEFSDLARLAGKKVGDRAWAAARGDAPRLLGMGIRPEDPSYYQGSTPDYTAQELQKQQTLPLEIQELLKRYIYPEKLFDIVNMQQDLSFKL